MRNEGQSGVHPHIPSHIYHPTHVHTYPKVTPIDLGLLIPEGRRGEDMVVARGGALTLMGGGAMDSSEEPS